jgi:predicted RNase H-like HicB family nuclease
MLDAHPSLWEHDRVKNYRVILIESEEGFAIGCPELPGCWSQGTTREEAIANIRDAIREWLAAEESDVTRVVEETVTV